MYTSNSCDITAFMQLLGDGVNYVETCSSKKILYLNVTSASFGVSNESFDQDTAPELPRSVGYGP
jgi:hypothetical protein